MRHEPVLQNQIDEYGMEELSNGGHFACMGIIDRDGYIVAQSSGFPDISSEELNMIIDGIDNPNSLARSGFTVGEKKYSLLPTGEHGQALRGTHKNGGISINRSNSHLVIGIYTDAVAKGDAWTRIDDLTKNIVDLGF